MALERNPAAPAPPTSPDTQVSAPGTSFSNVMRLPVDVGDPKPRLVLRDPLDAQLVRERHDARLARANPLSTATRPGDSPRCAGSTCGPPPCPAHRAPRHCAPARASIRAVSFQTARRPRRRRRRRRPRREDARALTASQHDSAQSPRATSATTAVENRSQGTHPTEAFIGIPILVTSS